MSLVFSPNVKQLSSETFLIRFFELSPIAISHVFWKQISHITSCVFPQIIKNSSHFKDHNQHTIAAISRLLLVNACTSWQNHNVNQKARVNKVTMLVPEVQPTYEEEALHAAVHKIPKIISVN